jgi:hypothetical protein
VIALILATLLGAFLGAGVMALAAAAGHASLCKEAEAQAAIAYARGLRKGREERP